MSNPFEDGTAHYCALRNDEGQYSIWPTSIEVPPGWKIAFGPSIRADCLEYIEAHWKDMRPQSLASSQIADAR
ncbi:MbtH family protein [Bradyrhizobium oligotrophicum]|uniref:MbtH family protein n=1 Tax=Bradyrhizobium oligotrophicum TaxID=44255 RepID=UPI000A075DA0|nr:MbtH family protein [Bradyrhizobium oligotrophicum]